MTVIKSFNVSTLKNDALTGFLNGVERVIDSDSSIGEMGIVKPFKEALDVYINELRKTNESFNERIREADSAVDHAWCVMHAQAEVFCEHPEPDKQKAGQTVLKVFNNYPNPIKLPYAEEYGIMEKLLRDLSEIDEATLVLISIDAWLIELQTCVERFLQIMHEKVESKAAIELGASKRIRQNLENAYRALVQKLNALSEIFPTDSLEKVNNEINALIGSQRAVQKMRKTLKQNSSANENNEE